jgi:hypothetical protein
MSKMAFTLFLSFVLGLGAAAHRMAEPTYAAVQLFPGPLGPLTGNVLFTSVEKGVVVSLSISGFPSEGGPWPYHGISCR